VRRPFVGSIIERHAARIVACPILPLISPNCRYACGDAPDTHIARQAAHVAAEDAGCRVHLHRWDATVRYYMCTKVGLRAELEEGVSIAALFVRLSTCYIRLQMVQLVGGSTRSNVWRECVQKKRTRQTAKGACGR